jgi:hypothetical protein
MNKKKLAAAMAAVFAYVKTSEEAAVYSAGQVIPLPDIALTQGLQQPGNVWGMSGRQTHMQANSMIQLRIFK